MFKIFLRLNNFMGPDIDFLGLSVRDEMTNYEQLKIKSIGYGIKFSEITKLRFTTISCALKT